LWKLFYTKDIRKCATSKTPSPQKKLGIPEARRLSRGPTEGTSSQNVDVEVRHRLAAVRPVVDDDAEPRVEHSGKAGYLLSTKEKRAE
jgi:hypothetical protein